MLADRIRMGSMKGIEIPLYFKGNNIANFVKAAAVYAGNVEFLSSYLRVWADAYYASGEDGEPGGYGAGYAGIYLISVGHDLKVYKKIRIRCNVALTNSTSASLRLECWYNSSPPNQVNSVTLVSGFNELTFTFIPAVQNVSTAIQLLAFPVAVAGAKVDMNITEIHLLG